MSTDKYKQACLIHKSKTDQAPLYIQDLFTNVTYCVSYSLRSDFGNYIGMVMIDLQKAFDTLDHFFLENKLKYIGLDGNAIAWFDAYLTNRMQVTDVGGISSDPRVVPCGIS